MSILGRRGRIGFRGGWSLTYAEPDYAYWRFADVPVLSSVVNWELELTVTAGEFERIAATRPGSENWTITVIAPGQRARVSGIALTGEEAAVIRSGARPLALLLPRLWARPLTLEEMMTR